jgi:hypothetical protein
LLQRGGIVFFEEADGDLHWWNRMPIAQLQRRRAASAAACRSGPRFRECSSRSAELVLVMCVLDVMPQYLLQSIGKSSWAVGPLLAKRPACEETCRSLRLRRTQTRGFHCLCDARGRIPKQSLLRCRLVGWESGPGPRPGSEPLQ